MYLNIFTKDPKSPWSKRTFHWFGSATWRWGTPVIIILFATLTWLVYALYQDASFLSGSSQTTAYFVGITGQYDRGNDTRVYNGQYTYQVDGLSYNIPVNREYSPDFNRTLTVTYKQSNPARAKLLYNVNTPAWSIVLDVTIALVMITVFFVFFYALALRAPQK